MVLDNSATTSPANDNNTPAAIDRIPRFFVGHEGLQFQIDHKAQEIPLDDPNSTYMFFPIGKPFIVTTPVAMAIPEPVILACLNQLCWFANKHQGLDYLQSFTVQDSAEPLWFIEDGEGGAITALFPSDY